MAVELEGLEFQIEAKSEEGTKGIDALTASLGKLKQATKGGLGLNSKVKELNKLNEALKGFHTDKLESLGKALASLNGLGKTQISSTIPKRLNEIAQSLHEIGLSDIERLEDLGKALRDLQEVGDVKIPKVTVPSAGVAPTMNGTTNAEAATSGVEQATSSVQETAHAVEQVTQKTGVLKSMLGKIGGAFSKGFSVGTGKLKELGSSMLQVGKSAMRSLNPINIFKKSAAGLAAKVKQTTSGLGKLFSSMSRIAMYRAIRFMFSQLTQAMKEGINNLYQYSNLMGGTFAQSMDRLATSGQYLKNSLGAMAASIINALAPAIDFVIDKIATLLNYINMLFARLSGASVFTAAKKNAVSYGDSLTKAGGSAAKAAKEIRDATIGIDELNIIMQKNDDAGGGGGGGADYGSMFEELPIDNSVSEFADKLKQAFESADWKALGTILGDKVNEIIDGINWEGIGHKVGFGINGAIQTAYWFLDTVNFTNIGSRIAEFLNGALEEIDFSYIGRLLVKKVTIIWDLFIGFFTTLDWGLVAKSFSDGLKGMYDEVTKWLNSHDWSELGSTLWQKIKDFVSNIDWGGIATSIFTYLGTAIRSAGEFLYGILSGIFKDIQKWWNEEISGEDWAGNLLKAIGKGFVNIGGWVWDNIIDPFGQALLGEKWDNIKEVGSNLIGKVKEGWDGVSRMKKNIGEFFVNVKNDATSWWSNTKAWWSGKVGAVKSFTTDVKNDASAWWSNVKSWWSGKVGAVQQFTTSVKNDSLTWWNNVKSWWSGKVGAVKEFTTTVTNQSSVWWNNVKTWWSGKVGAVQQFTTSVKNESSTWWSNVKSWWSGKVGAVQQFTTSVKNDSLTWWNNTKTWWSGKVGAVKEFTTSVRNDASTWWSNVKTWWSGVVGNLTVGVAIKNEATTWWNNVKRWWNDTVGDLWTTLKIKIPSISVKWSTVTVFGKDYSYPSGFNLTWNAKGGILDGAQIFGMLGNSFLGGGEAGKEAVLPLETHTEWMDTLAEKVRSGLPDNDTGGMEYGELKRALADFYTEYVQGTMSQMASDMNRQANKKEHTTVQVGNRVITDAVREQENANGYRFTTA
ncbi:hypothetical protein [Intestinimonas butyriciproducens]|uniref:hypothetical protein n=1 Tax=Intestinimonas butyriciproducens TaxID=1297617 RepID=UPI002430AA1A|nr:hypothetical protein [Intestinimonas butyriciproducens]MCI6363774.1 hypothetical protein [Intestinimonas butyriciproducens]